MKIQRHIDPLNDLPKGYKGGHEVGTDDPLSDDDLELGFCSYGMLDLDDMFGAFAQRQFGVVGGDKTVDDFTPEGIGWHTGDVGVGKASGNESRGSGHKEGLRSSVPEIRGDSTDEQDDIGVFEPDQGTRSPKDRGLDDDDEAGEYRGKGKRYP